MEHSSGEATFSEPGVPGDLGLHTEPGDLGPLAELRDLGTVAVALLQLGGGMAVCHTCSPDAMALSCGTETPVRDHGLPLPLRAACHSLSPGTSPKDPGKGTACLRAPPESPTCAPVPPPPAPPSLRQGLHCKCSGLTSPGGV